MNSASGWTSAAVLWLGCLCLVAIPANTYGQAPATAIADLAWIAGDWQTARGRPDRRSRNTGRSQPAAR